MHSLFYMHLNIIQYKKNMIWILCINYYRFIVTSNLRYHFRYYHTHTSYVADSTRTGPCIAMPLLDSNQSTSSYNISTKRKIGNFENNLTILL